MYVECQEQVGQAYKDRDNWTQMSILNTARMGKFSSDRAEEIWNAKPSRWNWNSIFKATPFEYGNAKNRDAVF
jgi:carbohydrate phosphorylase